MSENKSVFSTLSAISVREKVESKGKADYLSWANAWAMLKQHYPNAQRVVYESEHTGLNYFTDGKTAYVKVGIIVDGIEHIDYLPVMDFRNNSIPVDKLNSFEVNKTIQRSTAKAIAMHGLGLSLWTGEDIPDEPVAKEGKPVDESDKPELMKDTEDFERVSGYIASNKDKKFKDLVAQVSRKYTIKADVQKELEKIYKK